MKQLETRILTDTWVKATWEKYLQAVNAINNEKVKGYYYNGDYRLEMPPIGNDHASDHNIIIVGVNLYAICQQIDLNGKDNCSYRKTGFREVQPDVSYYIGKNAEIIPYGISIIDLDQYPTPDLVIEIAQTTLADDLGNKRLLYEDLGVSEYWVVDVQNSQVIAFKINNRGSQRLEISQALPGLKISLLNEALQRTRQSNHRLVGQWLMEQFQGLN